MITRRQLHNIGPTPDLEAEFGSRLNVVTGDNGLGKTFLLDACWFALTKRTWVRGRETASPITGAPEGRHYAPTVSVTRCRPCRGGGIFSDGFRWLAPPANFSRPSGPGSNGETATRGCRFVV